MTPFHCFEDTPTGDPAHPFPEISLYTTMEMIIIFIINGGDAKSSKFASIVPIFAYPEETFIHSIYI